MLGIDAQTEARRLHILHGLHLLTSPSPPRLTELCQKAQERFQVAMALITVIDRQTQVIKARVGTDLQGTARADAFCDQLIRSGNVLVVPDARLDARFASNPLVTGGPLIRFYAGAPLIFLPDVRLGGLCLLDPEPREFSPDDKAALAEMADEVILSILQHELEQFGALTRAAGVRDW